jgi:hypothetical protein
VALEHLAYEEAKRAIDRQSNQLDGLRARAGILLAAVALATSFLGGLALGDRDDLSASAIVFVVVAIGAFLVAAGECIRLLWPSSRAWAFNLTAGGILDKLEATDPDEATAYRQLAREHEANYDANEIRLEYLFGLFRRASAALAVEVAAWLAVLVSLAN